MNTKPDETIGIIPAPCPECGSKSVSLDDGSALLCWTCTLKAAAARDDEQPATDWQAEARAKAARLETMQKIRAVAQTAEMVPFDASHPAYMPAQMEHGRARSSTPGSREAVTELHRWLIPGKRFPIRNSLQINKHMPQIELGKTVKRIASDYTNGRTGRVIELDLRKPRARVSWERESNGSPMKLRTWVRLSDLIAV